MNLNRPDNSHPTEFFSSLITSNKSGAYYIGDISSTRNHPRYGVRTCLPWSETKFEPLDGKNHNFCRNPDGAKRGPFCVIARGKIGYCDVPKCPDFDSLNPEDTLFDGLLDGLVNIGGATYEQVGNFGTSIRDKIRDFQKNDPETSVSSLTIS